MKKKMEKVVEVVACLLVDGNRFLICQRPTNKARPLMWEFVGGKVEKGESRQEALIRECKEELAVDIGVDEKLSEHQHVYPDITINLTLFKCHLICGEVTLLEHQDAAWISIEETDQYQFCPADEEMLEVVCQTMRGN